MTIVFHRPSTIFWTYGAPIAGSTLRFDRQSTQKKDFIVEKEKCVGSRGNIGDRNTGDIPDYVNLFGRPAHSTGRNAEGRGQSNQHILLFACRMCLLCDCISLIGFGESDYLHDAFRQSSYPTNCGKYFVYMPLSLVRMELDFAEANPPT